MARTSEIALLGHTIAPCAKIETQRRAIARETVQNRRLAHKIVRMAERVSVSPIDVQTVFYSSTWEPTVLATCAWLIPRARYAPIRMKLLASA